MPALKVAARPVLGPALLPARGGADTATLTLARDATRREDLGGALADGAGPYRFAGRPSQPRDRRARLTVDGAGTVPTGAVRGAPFARVDVSAAPGVAARGGAWTSFADPRGDGPMGTVGEVARTTDAFGPTAMPPDATALPIDRFAADGAFDGGP